MTRPVRSRSSAFGNVDKLPSGKWRARYTGPDGKRRSATFTTKTDGRRWLATAQADLVRKQWRAPEAGKRTVGAFAEDYLARTDLRASTRALYATTWRLHLAPQWAGVPVGDVTPAQVRRWHEEAAKTTRATALAHAYRLLRSLFNVAVSDDVISANPCRLRSASTAKQARPSRALTVEEVRALAAAVPSRYRALVLVLAYGGLRFGEATALRRDDVSPDGATVRVERSVRNGVVGPPKTDAGVRTVTLPAFVAKEVVEHLAAHVGLEADAVAFGTKSGGYLARSNWSVMFGRACRATGLPPTRSHELRHTGSTLAVATGASTAEVMARLGHASPAAALRYQHAVASRDAEIARALDALGAG